MAKYGTQGTEFEVETTEGGGTYTKVIQIQNLTDNPTERPEIDVSDLDSVAVEVLPGLGSFGTMSGTVWHDPTDTSHALINTMYTSSSVRSMRVILPNDVGYFVFSGYVSLWGMPGTIGVNNALQTSLTIKKSGNVPFTAGAAP